VSDGGSSILDYDVTSIPGSIAATGLGSPIVVSGLSNGTPYTFKARARNAIGYSAYSAESNSVTPAGANTFTDVRDGEVYKFVTIGTQIWMAENFRGDFGSNHVYDANSAYLPTLGRLYDYTTAQASAPAGWHFPSPAEWNVMADFAGLPPAGKKLKANDPLWATNTGTDDYDFTFLPGGYWDYNGFYSTIGVFGFAWLESGVAQPGNTASYMSGSTDLIAYLSYDNRHGLSVRYVKD
jgi:uncharacterized protein (TIGR02145 family)